MLFNFASRKVIQIKEFFDPETEQKTNAILKDLKNEFEKEKIIFKNLVRSNIINGIETYSGNSNPDVLVLGVYEKSFFSNFFNESITKHFIGEGLIPLLIFKKELHDDQEKTE
jgi:nucleotide-binding universal stress UspA family protein